MSKSIPACRAQELGTLLGTTVNPPPEENLHSLSGLAAAQKEYRRSVLNGLLLLK
jgi:hypothetical protein